MSKKIDFSKVLDFSEMDLTAPNIVVEEILQQLPESTNSIIYGRISEYYGYVTSYKTIKHSIVETLGTVSTEKTVDIQNDLGKQGEEEHKYECFLYTSAYDNYKYRMFFMKYGIAYYPVQFTLDENIAESIQGSRLNYIVICNNREEVEQLISDILLSKRVVGVMQELIRIFQAKKEEVVTVPNASVET